MDTNDAALRPSFAAIPDADYVARRPELARFTPEAVAAGRVRCAEDIEETAQREYLIAYCEQRGIYGAYPRGYQAKIRGGQIVGGSGSF
jgi:hypothetical protein